MSSRPGIYVHYTNGNKPMTVIKNVFSVLNNKLIYTKEISVREMQNELSSLNKGINYDNCCNDNNILDADHKCAGCNKNLYWKHIAVNTGSEVWCAECSDINEGKIVCIKCESTKVETNSMGSYCPDCGYNVTLSAQHKVAPKIKNNNFDDVCNELLNLHIKQAKQQKQKQKQIDDIILHINNYFSKFIIIDVIPDLTIKIEYISSTRLLKFILADNYLIDDQINKHLKKYKSWFVPLSSSQQSDDTGMKFIITIKVQATPSFQEKVDEFNSI